ncbi:SDR family oxidoreductase [Kutzneria sp. CA-103260]|uniref:SDR family oxidoreductase n=1 Tax=Kutzneria sp. CA-103260 TaxID=2802641 RepID=UPI001BADFA21|nr:SDR family oxidoreductase [Kutzneria sp. CA-103260]QUQ66055.1 NAD dependent epimerase/dehydratase family protein [Kutzneria sp. CA-103260]
MTGHAVVVGGTGVTGGAIVDRLAGAGWDVVSLSRRPRPERPGRAVAVDLLDRDGAREALAGLHETTHVFYAAYLMKPTFAEEVEPNVALLANAVDAIAAVAPNLRHVNLIEGGKWYGFQLGPTRTPVREDAPRHLPPNFYYDQQDWLEAAAGRHGFGWSALRPEAVIGYALGNPMNLGMAITVYAEICAELGVPFAFPGSLATWDSVYELTDARLLARAAEWAATTPAAAGEAFNITNGDVFRWSTLWPRLAETYRLPHAEPRPMRLAEVMADKAPVWDRIVARHGLVATKFEETASWPFADAILNMGSDIFRSTMKARRHGFDGFVESERSFAEFVDGLRRDKIIPGRR